jgi:hypothetical protein
MGWLGWGLGTAHAFTPTVIILFDVFGILLLGYSIYFIRKGRSLRRNYPASSNTLTQRTSKQFIVVVILECTAIAILGSIAYAFHRPDLAPVLAATVVGLHFLPLGKIFRQGRYYFWAFRCSSGGKFPGVFSQLSSFFTLTRCRVGSSQTSTITLLICEPSLTQPTCWRRFNPRRAAS